MYRGKGMKVKKKNKPRLSRGVQNVLWLILFVLIWEGTTRLGLVNSFILPPFTSVVGRMIEECFTGTLGLQVLNSLLLVIEGFALSLAISVVIAVLCTKFRTVESLFIALCSVMNPLPGIAVLPLIMMWFGASNGAMLALIIHGVIWPLVSNLISGFRAVPTVYTEYAENIGLPPYKVVVDILIFSVMPFFLNGIRIGWGRAWRALISAEMIFGMVGTLGGLGYYIYTNKAYANMTNVMAGVLMIVIIGIAVEKTLQLLEKNTIEKWGMSNAE